MEGDFKEAGNDCFIAQVHTLEDEFDDFSSSEEDIIGNLFKK